MHGDDVLDLVARVEKLCQERGEVPIAEVEKMALNKGIRPTAVLDELCVSSDIKVDLAGGRIYCR